MIWDFDSLKSSFIFYLLWSSFSLLLLKYEKVSAFFKYKVVMYGVRVVKCFCSLNTKKWSWYHPSPLIPLGG